MTTYELNFNKIYNLYKNQPLATAYLTIKQTIIPHKINLNHHNLSSI